MISWRTCRVSECMTCWFGWNYLIGWALLLALGLIGTARYRTIQKDWKRWSLGNDTYVMIGMDGIGIGGGV